MLELANDIMRRKDAGKVAPEWVSYAVGQYLDFFPDFNILSIDQSNAFD